jgi:hypothetical protein
MTAGNESRDEDESLELPVLRLQIGEAARMLRTSRAQLYNRIGEGMIRPQKDGARTYITRSEIERYGSIGEMARNSRDSPGDALPATLP